MPKNESEVVLNYFHDKNRPFSATDVFNNLKKEVSKPSLLKTIDQLVSEEKLVEKVYGKAKVYIINQNRFEKPSDEELSEMKTRSADLSQKLEKVKQEIKAIDSKLKKYSSTLTIEELNSKIAHLETLINEKTKKLEAFKSSQVELIDPNAKKDCKARHETVLKENKKRQRALKDLLDNIAENYPKSKRHLYEDIGIED